ncbi:hypothetical protein [Sphingosinicella soli]|uniref:Uncharacterized protein n=1 Tax=Sphingosinicella soli TaxID=333708 RepID=A0A7W7AY92_9SPHN|nr:hypothetical protein [Sphingosinicella soli]MBB4630601.1 hypothetical protein [Sphingosinicella soli]
MTERGLSLAEIIGAKLRGMFRARRARHAIPAEAAPAMPRVQRPVAATAICLADDRLISAYRDLLRAPA